MKRYKVVKGSVSAHCCFEATVTDTENKEPGELGENGRPVCECFDINDAQAICDALNILAEG